jgi:hypothetical protein
MDDQIRRMLDQFNAIHDPTRSVLDSLRSAALPAQQAALASLEWDRSSAARDAFDSLERTRLVDTFAGAYQPSSLAMMNDVLASFQDARYSSDHLAANIYKELVDNREYGVIGQLGAANFTLQDSYSRLADLQKSVAEQLAGAIPRLEDFSPLLSAQSQWARTAQIPSSMEQMWLFATESRVLIDQVWDLRSFLGPLSSSLDEEEVYEEGEEEVIAFANERLAGAFFERSPSLTISKIQEFLDAIKSDAIRLAPRAKALFLVILVGVISNFIYDASKSYVLARSPDAPRVVKEVRREVKKMQRSVASFPPEARVVIAGELIVRRGPAQSTPAIGRLYAADIVWIVKTRARSWSLVEFDDGEGEIVLRGWVYSRYLKPLRGTGRSVRHRPSLPGLPPGAGAFDSGFTDTAERSEELLGELGFGEDFLK